MELRTAAIVVLPVAIGLLTAIGSTRDSVDPAGGWFIAAYFLTGLLVGIVFGRRTPRSVRQMDDEQLRRHAMRVANRIIRCDPKQKLYGRLRPRSPFGTNSTITRHIEELETWHGKLRMQRPRWTRPTRRYTKRLHRTFRDVVDELARRGIRDARLTYYADHRPAKTSLGDAANSLAFHAEVLPGGSARWRQ